MPLSRLELVDACANEYTLFGWFDSLNAVHYIARADKAGYHTHLLFESLRNELEDRSIAHSQGARHDEQQDSIPTKPPKVTK